VKIALCLFGYSKGSTVYAGGAYLSKFKHLFEQVMVHDPDVFIHCWEPELEKELVSLFKPKMYSFQNQLSFKDKIGNFDNHRFRNSRGDIFKTLSFFYTRKKANDLKILAEKEGGFTYDCVITSRFDAGYHNHGKNQTSYIDFNLHSDMSCVYSAYWPQINAGISDHWFYSNSENIDKICDIYDHVLSYLVADSEYCQTMREGWFDSSEDEQYSNEFLKNSKLRTTNLKKYVDHYCLNNHCLYKWHFYKKGLWHPDRCKFLNEELWK